jgi:hypothetical protein
MAEWLLAAVPMYYLANRRVHTSMLNKWSKQSRKAVRKWMIANSMCTSAIHLPKGMHGLGVMNVGNINKECKLTIFTQFLFSNNSKLRENTIANLQTEWSKQKVIFNSEDVFSSV